MKWNGRYAREFHAPKAGALPGCATPRHLCSLDSRTLPSELLRERTAPGRRARRHGRGHRSGECGMCLPGTDATRGRRRSQKLPDPGAAIKREGALDVGRRRCRPRTFAAGVRPACLGGFPRGLESVQCSSGRWACPGTEQSHSAGDGRLRSLAPPVLGRRKRAPENRRCRCRLQGWSTSV